MRSNSPPARVRSPSCTRTEGLYGRTYCSMMATESDSGHVNEEIPHPSPRERFYRRERQSVPAARAFTREALADWGAVERSYDIVLCVSELATNALVHGVPPGRGFLLRLAVAVAVRRWRARRAARQRGRPTGRTAGGGRGAARGRAWAAAGVGAGGQVGRGGAGPREDRVVRVRRTVSLRAVLGITARRGPREFRAAPRSSPAGPAPCGRCSPEQPHRPCRTRCRTTA